MSLSDACEQYVSCMFMDLSAWHLLSCWSRDLSLQLHENGDDDVLLVTIAKELEDGSAQEAAQTLLQDKYEVIPHYIYNQKRAK